MWRASEQKFGLDSSEDLTFGLVCIMLLDFLYLFVASTLLGMAYGLVTAYCLRSYPFHHVSQVCPRCRRCQAAGLRAVQSPAALPGARHAGHHHRTSMPRRRWR